MKIKWLIIFLLTNAFAAFSQNPFEGEWKIDYLIGYGGEKASYFNEYLLYKLQGEDRNYGNNVAFLDGKFTCWYSAPCGNDCFPSSEGNFKMIDESHVVFELDTIYIGGYCSTREAKMDKQPIIYYFFEENNSIRLVKSDGVLKNDLDRQNYSNAIRKFELDPKNWSNLGNLPWYRLEEEFTTNEEALQSALKKIKNYTLGDGKILFSKPIRNNMCTAFLFEYNNKQALFLLLRQNICIVDL